MRRTTVLFVTHDIAEAVYLADSVAVMDAGRIALHIGIELARGRGPATRTSAAFTAHCAQVRRAMHMDAVAA
jgi:NitT/TauT family transport system ATP-binding protein